MDPWISADAWIIGGWVALSCGVLGLAARLFRCRFNGWRPGIPFLLILAAGGFVVLANNRALFTPDTVSGPWFIVYLAGLVGAAFLAKVHQVVEAYRRRRGAQASDDRAAAH